MQAIELEMFFLIFVLSVSPILSNSAIVGKCNKDRTSNRCRGANAFWQYDGICINATCHVADTWKFSFKLVAAVDQRLNISGSIPIQNLWVRGAGPKLSWEKSIKMTKVQESHWVIDINYVYDSNALLCLQESRCSLNQKALEFRVYRDEHGMDGMLGPNIYVPLPISSSNEGHPGFSPPLVFTYPWFDGTQVLPKRVYFSVPLSMARYLTTYIDATAFYPPSFQHNLFKRYPVVITFWRESDKLLIPLLKSMYTHESSIEEAFIFALNVKKRATSPFCRHNPFTILEADPSVSGSNLELKCTGDCAKCMTCFNPDRAELCDAKELKLQAERCGMVASSCGGLGDAILDNIENTLIPEMSAKTLGRLMVDFPKDRISIIGMDGSGLLACYAALSRPQVYKNAGCISATFHWPFRSLEVKESRKEQGIGLLFKEVTERMNLRKEFQLLHATQKYYIDVGEFDNDYMPIIEEHNYSDWVVEQLQSRLKIDEENILYYRNVRWGGNSEFFLRTERDIRLLNRIKVPLLFFLKPEGGLNAEYPRSPVIRSKDYTQRNDKLVPVAVNFKKTSTVSAKKPKINCRDMLQTGSKTVSVPIFLLSIGLSIFVSSVLSAVLMEMRYYNKRAAAEAEAQLSSDDEMELKKEK